MSGRIILPSDQAITKRVLGARGVWPYLDADQGRAGNGVLPQVPIVWVKYDPPSGLFVNKYAHLEHPAHHAKHEISIRLKCRLRQQARCAPLVEAGCR
jgi:hypothetical protein